MLAQVAQQLADEMVSVAQVVQHAAKDGVHIVILTHRSPEGAVRSAAAGVAAKPFSLAAPVVLPPVPRLSPDRAPRIVAVNISSQAVHPGDVVSGVVETTSNVASVEAHLATYAIPMQKIGVGKFTLKYQVPDIPFFFRGKTYAIDIVAHNTRGDTVST